MISDIDAFRAAWQASSAVVVSAKPDAKVQKALDALAIGVVARVAHGSTVEAALKPFAAAIRQKPEFTSDPSSLGASAYMDGDRWLVNVRMGPASSVAAFERSGQRLAMPSAQRWSYRYAGAFGSVGRLILFDAESIQDAGVRYRYRYAFLRRTPQGYASAGTLSGVWAFTDEGETPLRQDATRFAVRSLDDPKSFFVAAPVLLLRREEAWDASGPRLKLVSRRLLDPDIRAVDTWLATHRDTRLPNGTRIPKDVRMADFPVRSKGVVIIDLDGTNLRFTLAKRGDRNVVTGVTTAPTSRT